MAKLLLSSKIRIFVFTNPKKHNNMATIYTIICPKCGHKFEVTKGILMSEANLDPVPEERKEETPFKCPVCGLEMSTQDEDFNQHCESVIMAD